jgi:hypothetical protein
MLRTGFVIRVAWKNKSPAKPVNMRLFSRMMFFFKKIVAKLRAFDTFHVPPRKATVSLAETQSGERKINQKIR